MRSAYIDGLYKLVERQSEERELAKQQEQKRQTLQPAPKPLEQQVLDLTRGHNPDKKWTMAEFLACTEGTYSENSHPQKIAEILMRHKWRRYRSYGQNAGRYWLPPEK